MYNVLALCLVFFIWGGLEGVSNIFLELHSFRYYFSRIFRFLFCIFCYIASHRQQFNIFTNNNKHKEPFTIPEQFLAINITKDATHFLFIRLTLNWIQLCEILPCELIFNEYFFCFFSSFSHLS